MPLPLSVPAPSGARPRPRPLSVVVPAVASLAMAALGAPGASAAVRVGDERIVVSSGAARVVIDRAPLRMTFTDRRGRAVLRHVRGARGLPRRLPPTRDPEPLALEREPDRAVYAPLTFEVGTERREQWRGAFWPGNLLFSRRSGTTHAARAVVAARRAPGGAARLVLSTTDRTRRLIVRIAPDGRGVLRVNVKPTRAAGVITMADSFAAARRERFHGLGGRHNAIDQRGSKLYGWVEQENVGGRKTLSQTALLTPLIEQATAFTPAQLGVPATIDERLLPGGYDRYLVPGGPTAAYHPQNQFVSSRGYGFLLRQSELSRWRMANDRSDAWQVAASAPRLDYTVAVGAPPRAMRALTAKTGRHALPPAWSQGTLLWRAIRVGEPKETPESYRAKIDADLDEIERRGLPVAGYSFEGWALLGPDGTREVVARLRRMGIRAILYVRAYVAYDELNSQPAGDLEDVRDNGLAVKDAQGRPAAYEMTGATAYTLDFTNPATVAWWRERLKLLLDLGADGFMQDFGEHVMETDRFHDGSTGRTMHNRYPVLYHAVTKRLLAELAPGREIFWFTRAGFTGSAAHEMANFPGDETASWDGGTGIRSLAPDMLNRAVGGAFGFTTDIGGYLDLFDGPPDAELYSRWAEWSALTPFFRVHNAQRTGTRMPWSYDEATYARFVAAARLHQRAVPLIRRLWAEGRRTGVPPTRPMWLAMPRDPRAARADQQWMLGPDVVVAPVVTRSASSRRVLLPPGCWQQQEADGAARVRGPRVVTAPAPLGRLPYFFRCGRTPF